MAAAAATTPTRSGTRRTTRRKPVTQRTGVSVWAQQISDEELHCRDLGHNWVDHAASEDTRKRTLIQVLRCPRCTTVRTRMIAAWSGEVLATNYKYPKTYCAPKGVGRLDASVRGTLRVTKIRRVLDAARDAASKSAALATNVVSISNGKNT